jgi:hypothetical protein
MGALAFSVKGSFDILALSDYMEAAVGVTLIIIGCMGLRKAKLWRLELKKADDESFDALESGQLPVANARKEEGEAKYHHHSPHHLTMTGAWGILSTGIFHGFSGSGHFLGVMPALLLPRYFPRALAHFLYTHCYPRKIHTFIVFTCSWRGAIAYLVAFCLGTMVAMSAFTGVVGEMSVRAGKHANQPDLPVTLSSISSRFGAHPNFLALARLIHLYKHTHTHTHTHNTTHTYIHTHTHTHTHMHTRTHTRTHTHPYTHTLTHTQHTHVHTHTHARTHRHTHTQAHTGTHTHTTHTHNTHTHTTHTHTHAHRETHTHTHTHIHT